MLTHVQYTVSQVVKCMRLYFLDIGLRLQGNVHTRSAHVLNASHTRSRYIPHVFQMRPHLAKKGSGTHVHLAATLS